MRVTVVSEPRAHSRPFRAASFLGFVLLGGAVALYGPAVPLFAAEHGIATAVAGLALPVHSVAAVLGVLGWGALDRKGHVRRALAAGAGTTATGALAVAFAPTFAVVLAGVAGIGAGFGITNTGMNALFARDRTVGAAARMNALHSMFGIGAVITPLVLSVAGLRVTFVLVALLMLTILPVMRQAVDPGVAEPEDPSPEARRAARVVMLGFLALFGLYIGTELGVANWMAAHLTDQGWSVAAAARWTSAYFLAFTIGRLLAARFATGVDPARLVIAALVLGAGTVALANVVAITPYAYVAVGLVVAPVFPTAMVWLTRRLPEARHGPAGAMLAGSAGAAVLPTLIATLVGARGTAVVPTTVAVLALVATAIALWLRRTSSRPVVAASPRD